MKKTLIAIALAAIVAPAWGAEVVSSNIVGYQKLTISGPFTMIGTSFQNVGVDKQLSVRDITATGLVGVDWSFETEVGDTILIWNPGEQAYLTTLYWAGDVATADMDDYGAEPGTWYDMAAGETSSLALKNGSAFWIQSASSEATVTIAGEVPTEADSIQLSIGFNMLANPYPKAVAINDLFTVTGLTGVDWSFETEVGDTLLIWDPDQQAYLTTLYWAGDVATADMDDYGAEPGTWYDMAAGETATTEIPPSGAFWIVSSGSGTVTFK